MQKMKSLTELQILQNKSTQPIADQLVEIVNARMRNDLAGENQATKELESILRFNQGIADLLGRKRTMIEVKPKPKHFAEEIEDANDYDLEKSFDLPFSEAIESILNYQLYQEFGPRLYAQTVQEVNKIYGPQAPPRYRAFGITDAKNEAFQKVNSLIRDQLEFGTPRQKTIEQIRKEMVPFARSQAETIYRTQTAKAYSAGRWRQLEDPVVRSLVGAIQFNTVGDRNTRPEHKKLDGFVGAKNDPIWNWITPPIYFNCRCSITIIPKSVLVSRRLIDSRGKLIPQQRPPIPTENFGRRHDKTIYDVYGSN